jgi:hypothetical protein
MSIYTVHRRLIAWGQRAAVGHVYAEGTDSRRATRADKR